MPRTLLLERRNVESLVTMESAIGAVEAAFSEHGRGRTMMPPKVYLSLEKQHGGDFRAMPSYMDGLAGVKWVNSHPDNPSTSGLPSVMGIYVLSDAATARPLAVLDATWLTAVRTGAAGAVATKHLHRRTPRTVGFIGCGVQARVLFRAHRVLYPAFESVCADARAEAAAGFAAEIGGRVGSVAEAAGCDVVCLATPGRAPVVLREHLASGAHVNAMGADAPGKQEVHAEALRAARVYVDDMEQATHSGEVNVPIHDGLFAESDIAGTLGGVVAGVLPPPPEGAITLFDSTGLAVQDLAVARVVYERALREKVGIEVDFLGLG
ncbi:MAG: ornithine cyclodeaminase family protein [Polyangiaceae bacterium]